ncbi:MAG: hypothetical protein P8X82_08645 [Gemmatimonadales bacterium]|jgi:hypothetical protein
MVSIVSLWLPILLSAVVVFVLSSVIHMVLGYHNTDFGKVPSEDQVMDALRPFNIPPGDYAIPRAGSQKEMGTPEFTEKLNKGPVAFISVMPNGQPSMGKSLTQWFVYCVVVGVFAAYVTSRAVDPNPDYLQVFRFAGCTAFIGYTVALWQNSIWYRRAWSTTIKSTIDGLIYALFTAGVFGWLWPG